MSTCLAFETSGQYCSVAIAHQGEIYQQVHRVPRTHNAHIHRLVRTVLAEAGLSLQQIDILAVSIGPGSFTGIRLGLSVVQGFAYGLDIPVIPVSTLAVTAAYGYHQIPHATQPILVGLDARMDQIYWGIYKKSATQLVETLSPDALSNPEDISADAASYAVGPAWQAYQDALPQSIQTKITTQATSIVPYAEWVARLASVRINQAQAPEMLQAQYLRNQVAHSSSS